MQRILTLPVVDSATEVTFVRLALTFPVQLGLVDTDNGEEVSLVPWEDNEVALPPGESRTIMARYDAGAGVGNLALEVGGCDVAKHSIGVHGGRRDRIT